MRKLVVVALAVVLSAGSMSAAQAKTKPKYTVTISTSAGGIELGETVKLTGTVSPNAKGKSVKIQRRYAGGSWTTITTTKLSRSSTYSATIRPSRGGSTDYRVQKSGTSKRSTGTSLSRSLNVFKWLDLTTIPMEAGINVGSPTPTTTIKNTVFGRSIRGNGLYALDASWDLSGRRCDAYRMFVGMAQPADGTVVGDFKVGQYDDAGNGAVIDETYGMKASDHARYFSRTFPTTNAHLRLFIDTYNGSGIGAAAEPAVHCIANS